MRARHLLPKKHASSIMIKRKISTILLNLRGDAFTMHVAICDDESEELRRITSLVEEYRLSHPDRPIHTTTFRSGSALLTALEREKTGFDLYLLDVIMPDMTGIQLADRIHARQRKADIVFLTTSREYALEAFRVRARHYLLKPLERTVFFAMLDELTLSPASAETAFTIPAAQNLDLTLPASSIAYAECVAHTVRYHLVDGSTVESRTLRIPFSETVAPLLETGRFLTIHRSFTVNLEQVQRVTERAVFLKVGTELPIARLRQREIRTAYIDFLSQTGWGED